MSSDAVLPAAEQSAAPTVWTKLDAWLVRMGERLNPILVKEARQAMKSKQFMLTFIVVLVVTWGWTLWRIADLGPDIYYRASGADFFMGYFVILTFALLVIVPYGAFRSLAQECEDRTYELLSITTLGPRQIVVGKLSSAALQMLVFFSAMAPCLAFTYLLRGIDIVMIIVLLAYAGLGSLGLSMIGLFFATISTERHWQIVLSVILVVGLIFSFGSGIAICENFIRHEHRSLQLAEFWIVMGGLFTFYATTFVIVFLAATAQLTFACDNRSTPLRIAILAQTLLFIGWCAALMRIGRGFEAEALCIILCLFAGYWYGMGCMMVCESPDISLRVRRTLPASGWGRALLSWFYPGPGRGFLFTLASFLGGCVLAGIVLIVYYDSPNFRRFRFATAKSVMLVAFLLFCYLVIYLGVTQGIVRWLRRRNWIASVPVPVGLMIGSVLLILGWLVPAVLESMFASRYDRSYSLLHITNPFETLANAFLSRPFANYEYVLVWIVLLGGGALVMFALNVRPLFRELGLERLAQPVRVVEDDVVLHPPAPPQPTNPWDAEPDA